MKKIWFFGCFFWLSTAQGQGIPSLPVVGFYQVVEMVQKETGYWTVFCKQGEVEPSLEIKTRVKPLALNEHHTYEMQVEVLRKTGPMTEASQLLVFFPTPQGKTPVFILSSEKSAASFSGRFLEMNHPGFFTL